MSIEKDIQGIMEADVFKPADRGEWADRRKEAEVGIDKAGIVRTVESAIHSALAGYLWDDLLRDALIDFSAKELEWALNHLSHKVIVLDDPGYANEAKHTNYKKED